MSDVEWWNGLQAVGAVSCFGSFVSCVSKGKEGGAILNLILACWWTYKAVTP